MADDQLSRVFAALADPTRRDIVARLASQDATVNELAAPYDVTVQAVSKHLRVLRGAGLVEVRPEAQRRLYRISPKPLREIDSWLGPYRLLWDSRLDDLERHLDAMPDE